MFGKLIVFLAFIGPILHEDKNNMTTNKEVDLEKWLAIIKSINYYNREIFPKIFEQKAPQMNFYKVKPDFPYIQGMEMAANIATTLYDHLNFFLVYQTQINEREDKDRDEESAITILEAMKDLIIIAWNRLRVSQDYDKLQGVTDTLLRSRYTNNTLLKEIEFKVDKDQIKLEMLLDCYKSYQESKVPFDTALTEFKNSSQKLAKLEGLKFDNNFNSNFYLNYHIAMQEIVLDDITLSQFLKQQDSEWGNMLKSIDLETSQQQEIPLQQQQQQQLQERKVQQQNQFDKTFKLIKAACTESTESINSLTIIELNMYLEDIKRYRSTLLDIQAANDINMTEEDETFFKGIKGKIQLISKRLEELNKEHFKLKELEKLKIQGDSRGMETVKLKPLTGFHDFLSWKICMKALNKHQDPYKKAAALLNTLKVKEDIERTEGIYDYQELIKILDAKYSHQEILCPALINKLKGLPIAYNNETMVNNIGIILNITKQLKMLSKSALARFDLGVIEDLTRKLTLKAQEEFEHKWYEFKTIQMDVTNSTVISSESEDEVDTISVISGESKLKNGTSEMDKEAELKRRVFLGFLRVKEKILMNITARSTMLHGAIPKKICSKCHKQRQKCSCKPKEKLYTVSTEGKEVCPCCNKRVTHYTKGNRPTKSISRCPDFIKLSTDEKFKLAKKLKCCVICLNYNHTKAECRIDNMCVKCGKDKHHPSLCRMVEDTNSIEEVESQCITGEDQVIHGMIPIYVKDSRGKVVRIKCLFDTASTSNFIKRSTARRLGLKGVDINLNLTTVNKDQEMNSKKYKLTLLAPGPYEISVIQLDKIGNTKKSIPKQAMQQISEIFKINPNSISNIGGSVDLLLGLKNMELFPTFIKKSDNLHLYKTNGLYDKEHMILGNIGNLPTGKFADGKIPTGYSEEVHHLQGDIKKYMLGDNLGVQPMPLCIHCQKAASQACKSCKMLTNPISFKEAADAQLCQNSIFFDETKKETRVEYQYKGDIDSVFHRKHTNINLAEKLAKRLKTSLTKDELDAYTDAFLDMEQRGVIREITPEEDKDWTGPINYCSHHPVHKITSATTKIRPVCNSSLPHNGTTLNNLLPKPPKSITNLLNVLHRFRSKPFTLITDIKKAYNSIKTGIKDFHLRRFLWYRKDQLNSPNPKLTTWGTERMAFGDTPASYYLELAKQNVAQYTEKNYDKNLGKEIMQSSYVDDMTISEESVDTVKSYEKILPKTFGQFGFSFKEIFIGGCDNKSIDPDDSKINLFGHIYDKINDNLEINLHANFSKKKRNAHVKKDLSINEDLGEPPTKKIILSLIGQQYDPIGFMSPYIGKFKIFFKNLFKKNYEWNQPLDDGDSKIAHKLIQDVLQAQQVGLSFPRSVKPKGFKLKTIACFVDASSEALMAVVYGIYTNESGDVHVSLLTSKHKVVNFSIPRNELCAMLVGHRLVFNYLTAIDEKPDSIIFFTDSTCTIDFLRNTYIAKEIFIANRVYEIIKIRKAMNITTKYKHVRSEENIADKGTRPNVPFEFLLTDEWKHGPRMLQNTEDINADIVILKDQEVVFNESLFSVSVKSQATNPIKELMYQTNNLLKIIRTICIIRAIFTNKSFKGAINYDFDKAFLYLAYLTQTQYDVTQMKTKQLTTFEEDNIIYTKMRYTEDIMSNVFNKDKLIVIPGRSRLAKLVLLHAHKSNTGLIHDQNHHGLKQTLINSRIHPQFGCYITYAKSIAKGIINSCSVCRKLYKSNLINDAQMDSRKHAFDPKYMNKDCGAFQSICIDYFGPFHVREPKSRTTRSTKVPRKIYGMAVLDNITRAVQFYPVESYNTESFLTTFRIHTNLYGVPEEVISDPMTAFIKGSKELDSDITEDALRGFQNFETNLRREFAMKWKFIPAGSQWRNPAERTIKSFKEQLMKIFNLKNDDKPILTTNEYWLLFTDISEQLNRRPIQGFLDQENDLQFVSPNSLLMGRPTKNKTDNLIIKDAFQRLDLINSIKQNFFQNIIDIIIRDHVLFKTPKWYTQSRKPKVDDVVLILYKTKVNDHYKIGKITNVDEDGRNLECLVSPIQNGKIVETIKPPVKMKIPTQRSLLLYTKDFENE